MPEPKLLELDGIAQPVSEWAADYGITSRLIRLRLSWGWSVRRAILEPMRCYPGMRLTEPDSRPGGSRRLSRAGKGTGGGGSRDIGRKQELQP